MCIVINLFTELYRLSQVSYITLQNVSSLVVFLFVFKLYLDITVSGDSVDFFIFLWDTLICQEEFFLNI